MAKGKSKSRVARWSDAHGRAEAVIDQIRSFMDELTFALGDLRDLQQEYQEWRDNLPENMEGTATAEKLDALLELDLESVADDPLTVDLQQISDLVEECGAADLPLGFGRD